MKNRSRPFHCAIAGKVVGITLRHGGGLGEPANVYVRCDERDCQYVDLNQPPCPLRIDLFADGSDRLTAEYLASHPGERVCYACLTSVLGITHDQVRRASWRLKDDPGFSIRPSRCMVCRRRRVTIALEGDAAVPLSTAPSPLAPEPVAASILEALQRYLRGHGAFPFCAHCLARELAVPAAAVREAMFALERDPVFHVRTAQCVSCLLTKRTIHYEEPGSVDAPRRVIDLLVRSAGMSLCPTCVAFATDIALADARRILHNLAGVREFPREEAACGACGRWQVVVRFRGDQAAAAERVGEIGDVLTGRLRHRGLAIELLSFRTAEGWRPFALIKAMAGALVPDVPTIVLGLVSTKIEADEVAAAKAREWIDKRVP